jgi:hypothetical protein
MRIAATLIGRKLAKPLQPGTYLAALLRVAWPLFALALLIMGGSAYARFILDVRSTFLNIGRSTGSRW